MMQTVSEWMGDMHWRRQGGPAPLNGGANKNFLSKKRDFQVSRDLSSSPQT